MRRFGAPRELVPAAGEHLGRSGWRRVSQEQVNRFAAETGDRQWIHVDEQRAGAGPFGAPVAHGYYLLSLVPGLLGEVLAVEGTALVLNKELRALRFQAPVLVGDRVRIGVDLAAARRRPRGYWEAELRVRMHRDGTDDPVLRAEIVYLYQES